MCASSLSGTLLHMSVNLFDRHTPLQTLQWHQRQLCHAAAATDRATHLSDEFKLQLCQVHHIAEGNPSKIIVRLACFKLEAHAAHCRCMLLHQEKDRAKCTLCVTIHLDADSAEAGKPAQQQQSTSTHITSHSRQCGSHLNITGVLLLDLT